MPRRRIGRQISGRGSEWNSNGQDTRLGRLRLEIGLLIISGLGATAVYCTKVAPLSASPKSPPSGVSIAWAGQQLRGYSETNYISAESCSAPTRVVLDLYRTGTAPEPEYAQQLRPGQIAFAIEGDPNIRPTDVKIWESRPDQGVGYQLLYGTRDDLPKPLSFRAQIRRNASTGEQESIAFIFAWNPVSRPDIDVAFEADWLSPRIPGISCWLTVPGQLGEGVGTSSIANIAIGHAKWSRGYLGLPLFNAGTFVNKDGDGRLIVDSSASTPIPHNIYPASWDCGGSNFQASACQAVAALEPPNAEASRSAGLVLWSTVGGLLLSICGGSIIAAIRHAVRMRSTH